MKTKRIVFGLLTVAMGGLLAVGCGQAAAPAAATPTKAAVTAAPTKPAVVASPAAAAPSGTSAGAAAGGDVAAGKSVFDSNCTGCHPGGGAGAGPAVKGKSPEDIKKQVRSGGAEMPSFGTGQISDQQLNALVAYVASLK